LSNLHCHARHDTDMTVLSCLVWRCELSRPDSQTGAFCVRSVSERVRRRSATAGRTPPQNALVRRSVHTAADTTRRHCLVVSGVWCELAIKSERRVLRVRKCPTTSLPLGCRGCCIFGGHARSSIGDGLCWISTPEFCSRLRRGGPKSRLRGESRGRNTGRSPSVPVSVLKVSPPSTSPVVDIYRRGLCDTRSCEPTSRRIADFSAASNPGFDLPIEHGSKPSRLKVTKVLRVRGVSVSAYMTQQWRLCENGCTKLGFTIPKTRLVWKHLSDANLATEKA